MSNVAAIWGESWRWVGSVSGGHHYAANLAFNGDDAGAKADVRALIDRLGFFGIDRGAQAVGARLAQFPGGPLPGLNLVRFS